MKIDLPQINNFKTLFIVFSIGVALIYLLSTNLNYLNQLTSAQQQQSELNKFKTDQLQKNNEITTELDNINKTYKQAIVVYESILDRKASNINDYDRSFAEVLNLLAERNYSSAETNLKLITEQLQSETPKTTPSPSNPHPKVDMINADLKTTKIIVDTASDTDCTNNCPVLSLKDYVTRNNAFAAINGAYFCPAEYPTCVGKTNSYDTLLMNKNKHYFNSDNNIYSTVPAVIFGPGWIRFVSKSQEWGRDTSIDSMIANHPLLIQNSQIVFSGGNDSKWSSKGPRNFIANQGDTVYIGIVHNATLTEATQVLQDLGMENALNLDSGGSSALWNGKYLVGPGRPIPSAILFIKK